MQKAKPSKPAKVKASKGKVTKKVAAKTNKKKGLMGKEPVKRKQCTEKKVKPSISKPRKSKVKAKAQPSSSIQKDVEIAQAAFREIAPPKHVRFRPKDYYFWDEIITKFAKADWDDADLTIAALLARTLADIEKEQHLMRKEGGLLKQRSVLKGKNGKPDKLVVTGHCVNPRKLLIAEHSKNIFGYRRTLGLHARGTEGESRDMGKRRTAAKNLEDKILNNNDDDDDLLAKPPTLQ